MSQARDARATFNTFGTSTGIQPESGLWWNASQPGRGFNIEVQNNVMFFAGYLYNSDGTPQWYVAQGTYSNTLNGFDGPLLAFTGGQCLTCSFLPSLPAASPGDLTLRFTSINSGTLTWPGGTIPITRAIFGVTQDVRQLLGKWTFSAAVGTAQSGDWLNFNGYQVLAAGPTALGTNLAGRVVVSLIEGATLGILVDSSTSYYDFYAFPVSVTGVTNLGEGSYWRYLKTSNPSGTGRPAKAYKYAPAPAGVGNVEPDAQKSAPSIMRDLQMAIDAVEACSESFGSCQASE